MFPSLIGLQNNPLAEPLLSFAQESADAVISYLLENSPGASHRTAIPPCRRPWLLGPNVSLFLPFSSAVARAPPERKWIYPDSVDINKFESQMTQSTCPNSRLSVPAAFSKAVLLTLPIRVSPPPFCRYCYRLLLQRAVRQVRHATGLPVRLAGLRSVSARRLLPPAVFMCRTVVHGPLTPSSTPPPPSFPRSYCPQWALDWEHRKHSILKEILTHMSGEWQAAGGSRAGPCPPPQVLTSFALALPQTLSPCRRSSRASTTIFLRPK